MAKSKRTVVGSVCKSQDPNKADYIKVRGSHTLADGDYLNLESKKFQLESLDKAVAAGKLGGEIAEKARERINKIPDWVRFEIIKVTKSE